MDGVAGITLVAMTAAGAMPVLSKIVEQTLSDPEWLSTAVQVGFVKAKKARHH